jgi:hypothetical protein
VMHQVGDRCTSESVGQCSRTLILTLTETQDQPNPIQMTVTTVVRM